MKSEYQNTNFYDKVILVFMRFKLEESAYTYMYTERLSRS